MKWSQHTETIVAYLTKKVGWPHWGNRHSSRKWTDYTECSMNTVKKCYATLSLCRSGGGEQGCLAEKDLTHTHARTHTHTHTHTHTQQQQPPEQRAEANNTHTHTGWNIVKVQWTPRGSHDKLPLGFHDEIMAEAVGIPYTNNLVNLWERMPYQCPPREAM